MTSNYKNGGIWKKTIPWINVGGTWKVPSSSWIKVGSNWRSWFLQGGINDTGFAISDIANAVGGTNVTDIKLQADNKMLVLGNIYSFNGIKVNHLLRLNQNTTLDTDFLDNTGSGFDVYASCSELQPDGKIIVGGNFTTFNGTAMNRIVRLNSDGTRDTGFAIGTGANNIVESITVQPDKKVIIAGQFTTFNGSTVNRVVRLNEDGTRDTVFSANVGTGANSTIYNIYIQPDGKIILVGNFTTFNGTAINRIVRLNLDGTLDASFSTNIGTGANNIVRSITVQPDGKIILGGNFTTFNGAATNRIIRLNSDGTRDTGFSTGSGFNNTVIRFYLHSDGRILVLGAFTSYRSQSVNRIVCLNSDGTIDTGFVVANGFNNSTVAASILSDGGYLIGGQFSAHGIYQVNKLAYINSDGSYRTENLNSTGLSNTVYAIATQPDGKILAGGNFLFWGNETAPRVIRFNLDGSRDTDFIGFTNGGDVYKIFVESDANMLCGLGGVLWRLNSQGLGVESLASSPGTIYAIAKQSDGKILVGGTFTSVNGVSANRIYRLNSDGSLDTSFMSNVGTAAANYIYDIRVLSDDSIIVVGSFSSFNGLSANRVIKLNSDGTRDTGFMSPSSINNTIYSIDIQSDGKIIMCGNFNSPRVRVIRLNQDGAMDTSFDVGSGPDEVVFTCNVQEDGKIILGGGFKTFDGIVVNYIARLNSDGTLDNNFIANTGDISQKGFTSRVRSVQIALDNKILVGGEFLGFNSTARSYIARIGGDYTI